MAHIEPDLRERRAIEDMLNAKVPVSKIAADIGRHSSTVYPALWDRVRLGAENPVKDFEGHK